jgi:hypothetical protein
LKLYVWLGRKNAVSIPGNIAKTSIWCGFVHRVDLLFVFANTKEHLGNAPRAEPFRLRE